MKAAMLNIVKSASDYSYELIFVSLLTGQILYEIVSRLTFLLKYNVANWILLPLNLIKRHCFSWYQWEVGPELLVLLDLFYSFFFFLINKQETGSKHLATLLVPNNFI